MTRCPTVRMSSPTCQKCGKVFSRNDALQRHRRTKHSTKIFEDDAEDSDDEGANDEDVEDNHVPIKTKRYDFFGQLRCPKCDQIFGSQERLEHHLRKKNHRLEQFPCMYCTRVFPTQKELDNHFSKNTR